MSQNKGDVFAYDVMAAILNNLHILKNTQGFTSGTQRIWNQHLDIVHVYLHIIKKPPKTLFMSQNWDDVFVYYVMVAILNDLHILKKFKVSCLAAHQIRIQHLHVDKN